MTNMEWIEKMVAEGGNNYGKYVQEHKFEAEDIETAKLQRKCEECREYFVPPLLKSGKRSSKGKCPDCIEKAKKEKQERKKNPRRKMKEYERECSRCGRPVITTQAPREHVPIYCLKCRKEVKPDERMAKYREPVAV